MALRGKTAASRSLAHGQIVFCVQSDDLAAGRSDTRAAAGLGQVLTDQGHAVAIVGQESWHRLPVGALVVSVSPTFDPAWVPRDVPVVAWVCDQADAWAELRQLSHFDAILVSSHASAEGLAKTFAGRVGVLPIGIDSSLFRPHPVNRPADTVVALGAVKGASYFTLPDLYQRALVVVDDVGSTDTPFGTRISRLLETAACGAIPVIAHHDELADAMLEEVQVYQSAHEIDRMVRELRADPVATMATGSRLAAQVREVHSWERRASTFLTEVEPLLTRPNGSHPAPRSATLGFFPDYRHGNPYQSMLLCRPYGARCCRRSCRRPQRARAA